MAQASKVKTRYRVVGMLAQCGLGLREGFGQYFSASRCLNCHQDTHAAWSEIESEITLISCLPNLEDGGERSK